MAQIQRLRADEISDGNTVIAEYIEDELDQLINGHNDHDTRIESLEGGSAIIVGDPTFSGTVTFSDATDPIRTNLINERSSNFGVTIDSVLCKDGTIRVPGSAGYTPATNGDLGYDSTAHAYKVYVNGSAKTLATTDSVVITRSTQTSGFTAGLADKAKVFECSGSSFTMAFAAASTLGAGWYCYFTNTAAARSGFNITLDPSSTETISGASTLVLGPGSFGMIYCDGSNLFYQGVAIYESTAHSFTLNTDTAFTHSLGGVPDEADVTLVCTSADGGYSIGDVIKGLAYVNTTSGTSYGSGLQLGATAINLIQGDGFGAYHRKTATVGAGLNMDRTKWSVYVKGKRNVR